MARIISGYIFHQNLLNSFRDAIHILRIHLFRVLFKVFMGSNEVLWGIMRLNNGK